MLNQMLLQNWRRVMSLALVVIYLLLSVHASTAQNLSTSQVFVVFILMIIIAMTLESSSLENQELKLKSWTLNVEDDPDTGDKIITFPPDLLEEAGWKEGDDLIWTDQGDGSWLLTKKSV